MFEILRYTYKNKFHRGTNAAATAQRINDVYGDGIANGNTVRFWSGTFDLQNKPLVRPETKIDNEELNHQAN